MHWDSKILLNFPHFFISHNNGVLCKISLLHPCINVNQTKWYTEDIRHIYMIIKHSIITEIWCRKDEIHDGNSHVKEETRKDGEKTCKLYIVNYIVGVTVSTYPLFIFFFLFSFFRPFLFVIYGNLHKVLCMLS